MISAREWIPVEKQAPPTGHRPASVSGSARKRRVQNTSRWRQHDLSEADASPASSYFQIEASHGASAGTRTESSRRGWVGYVYAKGSVVIACNVTPTLQILPYIDGVNHIKRISKCAGVQEEIVLKCVQHLM